MGFFQSLIAGAAVLLFLLVVSLVIGIVLAVVLAWIGLSAWWVLGVLFLPLFIFLAWFCLG